MVRTRTTQGTREMIPLYIFDLDGTLADCTHRRPLLPDWDAFYAACDRDTPNKPIIHVMFDLMDHGNDVWIFSGRRDSEREKTIKWLEDHIGVTFNDEHLLMRPTGDNTPDDALKQSWLNAMLPIDRARLVATFDDRDRVVAMWRRNGITCLQVAPGDF